MILLASAVVSGLIMPDLRALAFSALLGALVAGLFYFKGPDWTTALGLSIGAFIVWCSVAVVAYFARWATTRQ